MELYLCQINNHSSTSVFIIEHTAWLCITVEDLMLMQSTERGMDPVAKIPMDFLPLGPFRSAACRNQREKLIHIATVIALVDKLDDAETDWDVFSLSVTIFWLS